MRERWLEGWEGGREEERRGGRDDDVETERDADKMLFKK